MFFERGYILVTNKLSLIEQETIICFNRAEKCAEVYTYDPKIKKKLKQLSEMSEADITAMGEDGSVTYKVRKELISIGN